MLSKSLLTRNVFQIMCYYFYHAKLEPLAVKTKCNVIKYPTQAATFTSGNVAVNQLYDLLSKKMFINDIDELK